MRLRAFLSLAALVAAVSCAPVPYAAYPGGPIAPVPQTGLAQAPLADRLLRAHNVERAAIGVAPLQWDASLAAAAASWAQVLAASGTMRHADRATRGAQGENLWMGSRGAFSPEQMVHGWASERRMFVPGIFPNVSRTGNWADVGHYTQMVWRTTTHLGCAIASSRTHDFLVCRYAPPGNVTGRPVY